MEESPAPSSVSGAPATVAPASSATAAPASLAPLAPAPGKDSAEAARQAAYSHFLQQFRVGLSQALLYESGTKQFDRVCDSTLAAATALLDLIGGFKLTISKGQAQFNAERADIPQSQRSTIDQLEKTMLAVGKNSLQFDKGLAAAELGAFLQLFARKKFPSNDGAKINQHLRDIGISHVQIDELRYVAIGAGQSVVDGEGTVLLHHAVAQKALEDLVGAMLLSVKRMGDAEGRAQMRAELVDQLIEKDPEMLASFLTATAQRLKSSEAGKDASASGPSAGGDATGNTPGEAHAAGETHEDLAGLAAVPARDGRLLADALQAARALLEKGAAGDDPVLQGIRKMIERLLQPYEHRAEEILALIELDEINLTLVPEWLRKTAASLRGGSADERLEAILRQSPGALLNEKIFPQIVDVLDELSVARMDAEAERLTAHMAGTLKLPTKRERMKAVQRLSFLLQRLMEQETRAVKNLEHALLDACTHETCDEVMKLLLEHLAGRCMHHYKNGLHERAGEYLQSIAGLEESSRSALRDEGANLARQAREHFGKGDFARTLIDDLLQGDVVGSAGAKPAARMIQLLGAAVWTVMAERVRADPLPARAEALAIHLHAFGKPAAQLCFAALTKQPDAAAATRMLHLAPVLGEEAELWSHIPALLRLADPAAQGAALDFVMKRDGPQAVQALAGLLREDTDVEKRKHWMSCLARLKDPGALKLLIHELETCTGAAELNEPFVLALLEQLGALEGRGAVEAVSRLLRPRGRTMILGGGGGGAPISKPVTIAAIRALGRHYKEPAVAELLEHVRANKDPDISRVAMVCIRGIVAQEIQAATEKEKEKAAAATVSAAPPPPRAGETSMIGRKSRRGFEDLKTDTKVDRLFKPGAAIGSSSVGAPKPASVFGAAPAAGVGPASLPASAPAQPGAAPSAPSPAQPGLTARFLARDSSEPALAALTPEWEGSLAQSAGLLALLRSLSGRDGTLRVALPAGEARLYLRGGKVLAAAWPGKKGLEALSAVHGLKDAACAFFAIPFNVPATVDVEIEQIESALQKHREQTEDNKYF